MRRADKELDAAIRERDKTKEQLRKLFTQTVIDDAISRLCVHCTCPCQGVLYPLTLTGKDCPYFTQQEEEE